MFDKTSWYRSSMPVYRCGINLAITIAVTLLLPIIGYSQMSDKSFSPNSIERKPIEGRQDRCKWLREAKFGMFIHWGLYAIPAGEWQGRDIAGVGEWIMHSAKIPSSEYKLLANQFNPVRFNAKEWVSIAKNAGMKYIVVTSKHHDGFCMYDTKLTNYDIVNATPFKRDPLKELAEECREQGIKLCIYYSTMDWHHQQFPAEHSVEGFHGQPNKNANLESYIEYMKSQVRELLTNYGPVGILWFDYGCAFKGCLPENDMAALVHAQDIIDMIHSIQPNCLINDRLGVDADYGTPEQYIPSKPEGAFEVCMTLNESWGYKKNDHSWKSPKTIIQNLVDVASKNGTYLLNVGPKADGTIPSISVEILQEVGKWLDKNGESIYGTSSSELAVPPWGRYTQKPGKMYAHVFDWPTNRQLRVTGLKNRIKEAYFLTDAFRSPLESDRMSNGDVVIKLPKLKGPPDTIDSVIVFEIERID